MEKVTFITLTGGVDTYWRAQLPVRHTGSHWIRVTHEDGQRAFGEPNRDTPFKWYPYINRKMYFPDNETFWGSFREIYDRVRYESVKGKTVVFTRPDGARAKHAISMESQGIRTIGELDDTLLSDPHLNIFMRQNKYNKVARRIHLKAMAAMTACVFSTEELRDAYHKEFKILCKGSDIKPPDLHVCHNNVDLDDWPQKADREQDGPLRVGWMGSAQHYRDIKLVYGALHHAQELGCSIYLIGADFSDLEGVTHPRAREATLRWAMLNPQKIPWIEPEEYHRTALPLDIGVCPLERNKHTMGKSDVKAIEYTMSGAAVLAQAHPVYTKYWKHNETCLLANSPEEFAHMMHDLVTQPKLRERLVEAAQQYVKEERTMQGIGKKEWEAVLQ